MWAEYAANPSAVSGIFSFFPDEASKIENYNISGVITTAFAHVALLPAYRLSTYDARTKVPLQVTAEIIGGIISGTISVWNDTLIQAANPLTSSFLPNIPINVVVRPVPCDANAMLVHYLKKSSSTFKRRYASTNSTADYDFKYSSLIPSSRLTYATSNSEVDLFTSTMEGSFGYYWLKRKMNTLSAVANFCHDPLCASGAVDPKQEASVLACQTNATKINPSEYLHTYDFTTSLNAGCYPLIGTVDYSILGTTNPLTCRDNGTHDANVLKNRMKFGSWLYSSSVVIKPLAINNVYPTSASDRSLSLKSICDVRCDDIVYGYQYCGFVDCTWARGDFIQTVHRCNPNTQSMSVTYSLKPGRLCILNPETSPVSGSEIPCSNVMGAYRYGKIASGLSILGMSVTALIMLFVFLNRHDKMIKKSQPFFIYIFIAGAFMMNLSILAFIGPNSDASCLLRPWCVNITSTIMFTPLLAKLHRIEVLFRMSKKMKKTRISDLTVRSTPTYLSIHPMPEDNYFYINYVVIVTFLLQLSTISPY